MKKLVLIAFVMLIAIPMVTRAQIKKAVPVAKSSPMQSMDMSSPTAKGKWLVGPSFGFNSTSYDDGNATIKQSYMDFQPEIGYFINDNISLGLSLALGADQVRVDGTATDKSSTFFVAPTLRYYLPISSKFQFLGKLQVPVGANKTTLDSGVDVDEKSTQFGVQAIPAFVFFPSNKIAIEMTFGSLHFNSRKEGGVTENNFGLSILSDNNFDYSLGAPSLGIKWHLGK
jgi:hypothetical protein